jgi:hypothetical protein
MCALKRRRGGNITWDPTPGARDNGDRGKVHGGEKKTMKRLPQDYYLHTNFSSPFPMLRQ